MTPKPADKPPGGALRRGWTTGACAAAAAKAALTALLTGHFPDPVEITLPGGQTPSFALALEGRDDDGARAGIVKDAGDDPDVTHGALIIASVSVAAAGAGLTFAAGEGVGTVTRAGLPLPVGAPAINPRPREMITRALADICEPMGRAMDFRVEISVPGGEALARKTWNPRLGIKGGISILGTTGIVIPYSCAAWIHSIHRGIDVARAGGIDHIAAATGRVSEAAAADLCGLPEMALIDMGDFAGGMLKYLRGHPIPRLSLAGGFAKICKLAMGRMDLHSGRGGVDMAWLADQVAACARPSDRAALAARARTANTAAEVLGFAPPQLAGRIASKAREQALTVLRGAPVAVEILIFDRAGTLVGRDGP